MKKALSLILAVLMASGVLTACAKSGDNENSVTTKQNSESTKAVSEETTGKYDIYDNLPNLNYNGDTITILSRGREWCKDEISVKDQNGEIINDAIYARNSAVEERLSIKINNILTTDTDNYTITNMIRTQVQSQTSEYDMFANSVYSSIMYTGEGLFKNLYDCEYIDFDQVYWSQGFNEVASIGKAQYFVTGPICLSTYRFIFATFLNRNMFTTNGIDLPYDIVRQGKWTIDYQYKITANIYSDTNGNGQKDANDTYGFVTGTEISVDNYWSSFKIPIIVKSTDNWYEYALDVNRLTTAVDKVNHLMWESDGSYVLPYRVDDTDQDDIAEKLSNGTAAMVTLRLIEVESSCLRNMTDDYGIIPMPKLDEAQDDYYSYAHDQLTALAIPITVTEEKFQMLGAALEALASESYRTVTPAYYEISLKTKYVNDVDSVEMLDKIVTNLYIDAGVLYTKDLSSVHQQLRTFMGKNSNTVASTMKSLSKVIDKQLNILIEGLKKIQN